MGNIKLTIFLVNESLHFKIGFSGNISHVLDLVKEGNKGESKQVVLLAEKEDRDKDGAAFTDDPKTSLSDVVELMNLVVESVHDYRIWSHIEE